MAVFTVPLLDQYLHTNVRIWGKIISILVVEVQQDHVLRYSVMIS
jgi:hypothetical protein